MKELVRALETGSMAQIGLLAFFVAFLFIIAYAVTRSKAQREDAKNLPLEDDEYVPGPPPSARR
jgi:cbb3-type cytochrome oxidase subunit 3